MKNIGTEKNNIWKRWMGAALFVFCLAIAVSAPVYAAETNEAIERLEEVYITGFFKDAPQRQLHWTYAGSGYAQQPYFFLPAGIDSDTVKIWFASKEKSGDGGVQYVLQDGYATVNGVRVNNGDSIKLPEDGGKLSIAAGNGTAVSVSVKRSAEVASVFIDTASGSMDKIHSSKSNKEKGDILLVRGDGTLDYQGTLKQIKGRGNATWDMAKKPYNIKLDESADLLGMGSAKGWCLLANYGDTSLLRNHVVYNLAEEAGIPFTMDSRSVDLYLNGTYNGTYLMTEKIEIGKNRVDITDMEKATEKVNTEDLDSYSAGGVSGYQRGTRKWANIPNDPEDITGGYLIEVELNDRYAAEACGFVTTMGQAVTMKAPEYVSENQINYIADLYQEMEDAIYSKNGYNTKGKHFSEYIDEESIAKMYVLQEYSLNLDTGITSFYLYKDSDQAGDGKFHMAPVWDFDMSTGNYGYRDGVNLSDPEVWWANRAQIYNVGGLNILAQAVQYESVKKLAVEQWNDVFYPIIRACLEEDTDDSMQKLKTLTEYQRELSASAEMNFLVWPDALRHTVTGIQNGRNFTESVDWLRNFLERREVFLHKAFAYGTASGYDVLKGTVSIVGTMRVGEEITAQIKDSNAKSFTYQWMADGETIPGASRETYLLTASDIGKTISVEIKAADQKLLKSVLGISDEKVQDSEPDPKPDPDPDPKPDPDPDPNPNPKPDPDPDPDPDLPVTPNPDPDPDPNLPVTPDPDPNPDSNQGQTQSPTVLAVSNVTGISSIKAGVKIQFGRTENASSYEIYRKAGNKLQKIATVKGTSYTDTNPVGGKKAVYMVKAVSDDQTKFKDADFGAGKSIKLPNAPGNFKGKAQKGGKVNLSWKKVKGASAYLIYRADSKNGKYKLVKTIKKQGTTAYADKKGLKKNRKYYYKAVVLKDGKYSPSSGAVKVAVKK